MSDSQRGGMCPVEGCLFIMEDGECWRYGEPQDPEYESTNDPVETEATGLGDFA